MKKWWAQPQVNYWGKFFIRTLFYGLIFLALIYLYHYKNIQGGSFIYNEF
ncbi:teichoic acid D-Ala incorporation-associated protein DltX [Enterococcus sp. DIV0660C]|nr:teichoic acid D-Ala incorporation-associated protein DltX [Enterococcus sp. DIV0660C]MBO0430932.1 teichoic acid D-Ala incorporation-associated protein DltX [Enterococcus sp. DIV0660C]